MKKNRCPWCETHLDYQTITIPNGVCPYTMILKLFETLLLETFQAGLNWLTVLRKRENFRIAFDNFDVHKIAGYKAEEN